MPEIYNCQLWEKARDLASERGLIMTPKCPVEKFCKVGCLLLKDEEKLEALRKELKSLGGE